MSHRAGAEPLLPVVAQAECQGQLLPSFTIMTQSWFVQTLAGRFEDLACVELVFGSHAALLAHWASFRHE